MANLTAPQTSVKNWTVCQGDALLHLRRMQGAGYAAIIFRPALCKRRHVHGRKEPKHP